MVFNSFVFVDDELVIGYDHENRAIQRRSLWDLVSSGDAKHFLVFDLDHTLVDFHAHGPEEFLYDFPGYTNRTPFAEKIAHFLGSKEASSVYFFICTGRTVSMMGKYGVRIIRSCIFKEAQNKLISAVCSAERLSDLVQVKRNFLLALQEELGRLNKLHNKSAKIIGFVDDLTQYAGSCGGITTFYNLPNPYDDKAVKQAIKSIKSSIVD